MEVAVFFKMSITTLEAIQCHNPQRHNLKKKEDNLIKGAVSIVSIYADFDINIFL